MSLFQHYQPEVNLVSSIIKTLLLFSLSSVFPFSFLFFFKQHRVLHVIEATLKGLAENLLKGYFLGLEIVMGIDPGYRRSGDHQQWASRKGKCGSMVASPDDPGSQVTHRDLGMRERNMTVEGREPGDKCHLFLRSSGAVFHG